MKYEKKHYYTDSEHYYSSKEVKESDIEGRWIPYQEYCHVVNKLNKLLQKGALKTEERK